MATNPNLERMNIGKPAPPRTQKKDKMGGQKGVATNRERAPLFKHNGRGQREVASGRHPRAHGHWHGHGGAGRMGMGEPPTLLAKKKTGQLGAATNQNQSARA